MNAEKPLEVFSPNFKPQSPKEYLLTEAKKCYQAIETLINFYLDIDKDYAKILSLWAIGTYFHKRFETFPFLFINAMRGSGKTRLLKLLEAVVYQGKITNNLSEAVLFRTAELNTILIDEFENIGSKEKTALKELLHAAYKKGAKVQRVKKSYSKEGEEMKIETFNVYTPIVLANITGIDDVLGDRCLTIILEKSANKSKTTLIEDFSQNPYFLDLKRTLSKVSVDSVDSVAPGRCRELHKWNIYTTTLHALPTLSTLPALDNQTKTDYFSSVLTAEQLVLFDKIRDLGIDGRNLELFFPLFIVADMLGAEVLEDILRISKDIVGSKKKDEFTQSFDVSLIDYISRKESTLKFFPIKDITNEFKMFVDIDNNSEEINNRWMSNALKRLKLTLDKRRVSHGVEVLLDINKAKERIKMFKEQEVNKDGKE